jgi:protein kinase-like protein
MNDAKNLKSDLDAIESELDRRQGDLATQAARLEAMLATLADGSPQQARAHRLMGVVLNRRKLDRQALQHLAEAKAKAEAASPTDFAELIKIGRETAVVHAWRGDDRKAARELLPALAFACLDDDRSEMARIVAELGRIELEAQRFGSVARLLQRFAGPDSGEMPQLPLPLPEPDASRMRINLCQALNRIGEHAEAKTRSERLLKYLAEDFKRLRLLARLELVRAEAGLGNLAEAEGILQDAKASLSNWQEGAYEQSEYLQAETELAERKGGPSLVDALETLIEEYSDQSLVIKEAVARRALATALFRQDQPKEACEALSVALRKALEQSNVPLAEELRADMLKSAGADYLEEVAQAIDLIGGGSELNLRFVRLGRLGKGGYGEVSKAIDLRNGQYLALKKLDFRAYDEDRRRAIINTVKTEFAATAKLNDSRFGRILDLLMEPGGALYIAQEFVDGPTLRKVYSSGTDPARLLPLLAHIADSLAYLHAKGIVHRDLKPENVIIRRQDGEDRPVLIDFGIAFIGGRADAFEHFGTPPYMAPELMSRGQVTPGGEVDVYALGQMIAEIWTGRNQPVPAVIEPLVRKLIEERPKRRFCDLKAIAAALRTPLQ